MWGWVLVGWIVGVVFEVVVGCKGVVGVVCRGFVGFRNGIGFVF